MKSLLDNSSRTILITGGSGYIGSVLTHHLATNGFRIVAIDKQPMPPSLKNHNNIHFFQGNYADPLLWKHITENFSCEALIHLAAYIEVGESVTHPAAYYDNNVAQLISMLELVRTAAIPTIIAASSSAVYGNPCTIPIPESHPRVPLSPYARTKVILEDILHDYHRAYGIQIGLLRFANVAGALPEYNLGERHEPESHLIPRVIQAIHAHETFILYGNDYPTPDGTCLRDFVHVHDVARLQERLLNLFHTSKNLPPITLNVGSGQGTSVQETIETMCSILQKTIVVEKKSRRPGDAPAIVLDIQKAYELTGWKPLASNLNTIITSACEFYKKPAPLMSEQIF